jgi:predicted Kef-type K+ transport protein
MPATTRSPGRPVNAPIDEQLLRVTQDLLVEMGGIAAQGWLIVEGDVVRVVDGVLLPALAAAGPSTEPPA